MATNKGGRPKKTIDYALVEELASIMCTQEEIAGVLSAKKDISVRTLQRDDKFCRVYKRSLQNAKSSLRRAQYKSALGGNATMLIWLGKQYLDQKDGATEALANFNVTVVDDLNGDS